MARDVIASFCPRYHRAVELIGRRWTGAIVRMLLAGPRRYNELADGVPEISDRMLAERLRELEAEGIVTRTVVPSAPVRVEYALTDKGRALEEAIVAIGRWAESWIEPGTPAARREPSAPASDAPASDAPAAPRMTEGSERGRRRRRAG